MSPFEGDLKQAIIRVSLQIGAELGEEGLTMRGIASRLGVSATALYQHFDSKAAILRAIRLDGLKRLSEHMHSEQTRSFDTLYNYGCRYVDFARKNPWLYTVMLGRENIDFDHLPDDERALLKIPHQMLLEACARGRSEGEFSGTFDPAVGAMVVWAALHGLALLMIGGRIKKSHPLYPVPDEDEFVHMFVHCVLETLNARGCVPASLRERELGTTPDESPV